MKHNQNIKTISNDTFFIIIFLIQMFKESSLIELHR